jgi:hypothetical protein
MPALTALLMVMGKFRSSSVSPTIGTETITGRTGVGPVLLTAVKSPAPCLVPCCSRSRRQRARERDGEVHVRRAPFPSVKNASPMSSTGAGPSSLVITMKPVSSMMSVTPAG